MISSITKTPFFTNHPLGTKFKDLAGKIYILRRYTDAHLQGTIYLWNQDSDECIYDTDEEIWDLAEPEPPDPQALLIRLLDCFHDGDRAELVDTLNDISMHIMTGRKLPHLSKDTTLSSYPTYIVLPNEEINTTTGTQDSTSTESITN